eukprot:TRINITY_DN510_c0_g1_i1.p1 TRINITY_DN510_c0_g1~~TRINITY_DN510_c0_g1_i1.p1  ORF type:complete len:435 (-),score=118.52 TRINITY_DN510_c0_g1_i1:167-1345(-)
MDSIASTCESLFKEEKWSDALGLLNPLLVSDSDNFELLLLKGTALRCMEHHLEALEVLKHAGLNVSAEEKCEKKARLDSELSACYASLGKMDDAMTHAQKSIEADSSNIMALCMMALGNFAQGDIEMMMTNAQIALSLDEDHPFANFAAGLSLMPMIEQGASPEEYLEKAHEKQPHVEDFTNLFADCLLTKGGMDMIPVVVSLFAKTIASLGDHAPPKPCPWPRTNPREVIWYRLIQILTQSGQLESALEIGEKAKTMFPMDNGMADMLHELRTKGVEMFADGCDCCDCHGDCSDCHGDCSDCCSHDHHDHDHHDHDHHDHDHHHEHHEHNGVGNDESEGSDTSSESDDDDDEVFYAATNIPPDDDADDDEENDDDDDDDDDDSEEDIHGGQ